MVQTKGLKVWHTIAEALACGRTLAEQEETIRRYGNHGLTPVLRAGLLAALGLPKPSAAAENCIIFGCYRPFTTPFLVKDYIRLLDILNIEYTYLEDEMCCGAPLAMLANDEERPAIMTVGEGFNQHNLELARQKGAKRQAYCCAGCVHAARNTFPESEDQHLYMLDLILDGLEGSSLSLPASEIGYFAGCHSFFHNTYPQARLDWTRYREMLESIEGLELVELPEKMCCKTSGEKIIEKAESLKLTRIISPCNWCHSSLQQYANGRVELVSLPELLLKCLEGGDFHSRKLSNEE